ncbi:MAG: hypothetical protein M3014_06270 [Chloroflexota bacterium]|nr:hypothetical protein [Chloroflexota bacterium]
MINTKVLTTHKVSAHVSTQDTISLVMVTILTLLALIAGLLLRNSVESRTRSYTDPSGVVVQYPDTWQLDATAAAQGTLAMHDTQAPDFPTTFELRRTAVAPKATDKAALSSVADTLALNRGRTSTAYKLFNVTQGQSIKGLPAASADYVYVKVPNGVLQSNLPAVVLGKDYLLRKGAKVYTLGLQATQSNMEQATQLFDKFIASAQLP